MCDSTVLTERGVVGAAASSRGVAGDSVQVAAGSRGHAAAGVERLDGGAPRVRQRLEAPSLPEVDPRLHTEEERVGSDIFSRKVQDRQIGRNVRENRITTLPTHCATPSVPAPLCPAPLSPALPCPTRTLPLPALTLVPRTSVPCTGHSSYVHVHPTNPCLQPTHASPNQPSHPRPTHLGGFAVWDTSRMRAASRPQHPAHPATPTRTPPRPHTPIPTPTHLGGFAV